MESNIAPQSTPPSSSLSRASKSQSPAMIKNERLKKKPNFRLPQSFVKVIAGRGDNAQTYSIHKDHLCHYSPFFNSAFNGNFEEARTQTMIMDDVYPVVFGLLVHWLYTKEIEFDELEGPEELVEEQQLIQLACLWNLADVAIIPQVQNEALFMINSLLWKRGQLPSDNHIYLEHIYRESGEGTTLRSFAVDLLAWGSNPEQLRDWMKSEIESKDMLIDVVMALKHGRDEQKGPMVELANYYI